MLNIFFVSLGCDKNLVDSEMMLGILRDRGYHLVNDEAEADIIIVNTCSFILDAKEESIQTLIEMGMMKQEGRCRLLIAAGCLAQRYRDEIFENMPEVDAILGTASFDRIDELIQEALAEKGAKCFEPLERMPTPAERRLVPTGSFAEYLKIAEGCDKHCSYCSIPSMRGRYRSYDMDYLEQQARSLAEEGVRELILIAQETTVYGVDLYGKKMLPELLRRLCRIEDLHWIRIMYCYPEEITPELLSVMKEEAKICHYLDLPIQHSEDRILRRMGRRTSRADLEEKIRMIREYLPDAALRTTLITGFPGETEQEHEALKDFISQIRFDRLGAFPYSQEEGTPAAEFADQIDEEVKTRRYDELMTLQQTIAFEKAEEMIGSRVQVIIEGYLPEEGIYAGRTYKDAPNVDGYVFVSYGGSLMSGDIIEAVITEAQGYDLIGEAEYESAE